MPTPIMAGRPMSQFSIPLVLLIFTLFVINFTLTACYNPRRSSRGRYKRVSDCQLCDQTDDFELFTNDSADEYVQMRYLYRGYTALTPANTQDNSPSHLMSGEAKKQIVVDKSGTQTALLDISGNLYILNGNVYTEEENLKQQVYKAFLVNAAGERLFLGNLKRGQDGKHHLRLRTKNLTQLTGYDNVMVTYQTNGDEYVILKGDF